MAMSVSSWWTASREALQPSSFHRFTKLGHNHFPVSNHHLRTPLLSGMQHLLGIETLTREEITFILDQSKPFQEFQRHPLKKLATLRGKTVAIAFFESSTGTRISFTTAASRLGADTM